ncbi:hypothetical protein F4777DRAFT_502427 [Nemania sp. FL0916]|nr:hypothetical protein F4777DRAFT_502427 [Nemania sp. FL0916]
MISSFVSFSLSCLFFRMGCFFFLLPDHPLRKQPRGKHLEERGSRIALYSSHLTVPYLTHTARHGIRHGMACMIRAGRQAEMELL